MTALERATNALGEIEAELLEPAKGGLDSVRLAERIRAVRKLLSNGEMRWVGTTEAKRLLGVGSENTVKAWARIGLLRSRTLLNGRVQVLLDDVLRRREDTEALSAIDGDQEISTEEGLRLLRPRPSEKS
jgi:hypothetical protein